MENNLIYDYCIQEKVVISFTNTDQMMMILGLMKVGNIEPTPGLYTKGGVISFYRYKSREGETRIRTRQFYTKEFDDHILLTAEEFFTLALPNKSILESI